MIFPPYYVDSFFLVCLFLLHFRFHTSEIWDEGGSVSVTPTKHHSPLTLFKLVRSIHVFPNSLIKS